MMGCSDVGDRALDYLYGLVEGPDREAFEAHAASCASCAGAVQKARERRALLREEAPPRVPPGLAERVLNAAPRRRARRLWPAAAAVLVAAAVSFSLVSGPSAAWVEGAGMLLRDGAKESFSGRVPLRTLDVVEAREPTVMALGGGRVDLSPAARAQSVESGVRLEAGEISCRVTRRFAVATPIADVKVLGTHFRVRLVEEEAMKGKAAAVGGAMVLTVAVVTGTVVVSNSRGEVTLQRDEAAAVRPGQAPVRVTDADLERLERELLEATREADEFEVEGTALRHAGQALLVELQRRKAQTAAPGKPAGQAANFKDMMRASMRIGLKRQLKPMVDPIDKKVRLAPEQRKEVEAAILAEFEKLIEKFIDGDFDSLEKFNDTAWMKDTITTLLRPDQQELYRQYVDEQAEATRKAQEEFQRERVDEFSKETGLSETQKKAVAETIGPELTPALTRWSLLYAQSAMGKITADEYKTKYDALVEGVVAKAKDHVTPEQLEALRRQVRGLLSLEGQMKLAGQEKNK